MRLRRRREPMIIEWGEWVPYGSAPDLPPPLKHARNVWMRARFAVEMLPARWRTRGGYRFTTLNDEGGHDYHWSVLPPDSRIHPGWKWDDRPWWRVWWMHDVRRRA